MDISAPQTSRNRHLFLPPIPDGTERAVSPWQGTRKAFKIGGGRRNTERRNTERARDAESKASPAGKGGVLFQEHVKPELCGTGPGGSGRRPSFLERRNAAPQGRPMVLEAVLQEIVK